MNKKELVAIRSYRPEDKKFIFSTFLRGLYYGSPYYSQMVKSVFMKQMQSALELILTNSKITVACFNEDPDTIFAYSITDTTNTVLHWVFCKSVYRGIGLTKELIPQTITSVSQLTKVGSSLLKKYPKVEFNPFLF